MDGAGEGGKTKGEALPHRTRQISGQFNVVIRTDYSVSCFRLTPSSIFSHGLSLTYVVDFCEKPFLSCSIFHSPFILFDLGFLDKNYFVYRQLPVLCGPTMEP